MIEDIRIKAGLPDHRKFKRLKRVVGDCAMELLLRFWLGVATQCPTGQLIGWDSVDVEEAAGWDGEPGEFCQALIDTGWLDPIDGGFMPHDWDEHQTWVIKYPERRAKAQKASRKRWGKDGDAQSNATSMPQVCSEDATSNAQSNAPTPAPSPSPSPTPTPLVNSESAEENLDVIVKRHLEVCGLSSSPPVHRIQGWFKKGMTMDDILTVYDKVGGYPMPSRQRLVIDMVENPKNARPKGMDKEGLKALENIMEGDS